MTTTRQLCAATTNAGTPCKHYSATGYDKCTSHLHGRAKGKARELDNRVRILTELRSGPLAAFVTPISEDDPESDFEQSLIMEHRRTIAAIRFCDEMIATLTNPEDLIFGTSGTVELEQTEDITASEFVGVNTKSSLSTTNAAVLNGWEQKRFAERRHLHDQHKLWISAKLDVKRLEIEQRTVEMLDVAISTIVGGLGRDQGDPEVRDVVRRALLQITKVA